MTNETRFSIKVRKNTEKYNFSASEFLRKASEKDVRKLMNIANQRIAKLKQRNLPSPALMALKEERGSETIFESRGLSNNQLKIEIARTLQFLRSPTSTVTGAKESIKNFGRQNKLSYDSALSILSKIDNKGFTRGSYSWLLYKEGYDDIIKEYELERENFSNESDFVDALNNYIIDIEQTQNIIINKVDKFFDKWY